MSSSGHTSGFRRPRWAFCFLGLLSYEYSSSVVQQDRTFHELDILFAKQVPARKFATTSIDEFNEHEQNQLAEQYSVAGLPPQRPSIVPSVTNFLASHGHAEDAAAQRRGSVTTDGRVSRRPSIAPAVTEYLKHG